MRKNFTELTIEELKELEHVFIDDLEYEELELNPLVVNINNCGCSGLNPCVMLYEITLTNNETVNIYA